MPDPQKEELDELQREIEGARTQAENHGTISDPDAPEPTYKTGGPVGLPVDEERDEDGD